MPNICEVCGEYFSMKSLLYKHLANHTFAEDIPSIKPIPGLMFACNMCGKEFTSSLRLRIHEKIHKTDSLPIFKKLDIKSPSLSQQTEGHTQVQSPKFECSDCQIPFKTKVAFSKHLKSLHDPLENVSHKQPDDHQHFNCLVCKRIIENEWELQKHEVCHSRSRDNKCTLCDKAFTIVAHLNRHVKLSHPKLHESPSEHQDLPKEKQFLNRSEIQTDKILVEAQKTNSLKNTSKSANHIITSDRPPYIFKKTPLDEVLLGPGPTLCNDSVKTESHLCEKSFYCKTCERNFPNVQAYNIHVSTHRNLPTTSILFQRHQRALNIPKSKSSSQNLDTDKKAGKAFSDKFKKGPNGPRTSIKKLKKLMALDTKKKIFVFDSSFIISDQYNLTCILCSKKFLALDDLKAHYFTHMHIPTFKCDICQAEFFDKIRLQDHVIQHQLDITFTCNVCSKAFADADQLRIHEVNQQHGLVIPLNAAAHLSSVGSALLIEHSQEHMNTLTLAISSAVDGISADGNSQFTCLGDEEEIEGGILTRNLPGGGQGIMVENTLNAIVVPTSGNLFAICKICGQGFDNKDKCDVHYELYHSTKAPFYCSFCRSTSLRKDRSKDPSTRDTYAGNEINPVSGAFDRKILLMKHLKRYHKNVYKNTRYKCSMCRATFSTEQSMKEHEQASHPFGSTNGNTLSLEDDEASRRFACQVCGSYFRQIVSVNLHIRRYHALDYEGIEYILQCNEIYQNESLYFATEVEYLNSSFQSYPLELNYPPKLGYCHRNFFELDDDATVFSGHQARLDFLQDIEPNFISDGTQGHALEATVKMTLPILCSTCGLFCQDRGEFLRHISDYSSYKPALGDILEARDSDKQLANDEETYECKQCFFLTKDVPIFNAHFHTDFHFHRQNNLLLFDSLKQLFPLHTVNSLIKIAANDIDRRDELNHLLRFRHNNAIKALDPNVFPIPTLPDQIIHCDLCRTAFTSKSNFVRHIIVHNTVRPYSCFLCGQAFIIIENLRKHFLIHFLILKTRIMELSSTYPSWHFHCICCNTVYSKKLDYQNHICTNDSYIQAKIDIVKKDDTTYMDKQTNMNFEPNISSAMKLWKCVDCKHSMINQDMYHSHICLGYSLLVPQYPFLADYNIQEAQTQFLGSYMPLPSNPGTPSINVLQPNDSHDPNMSNKRIEAGDLFNPIVRNHHDMSHLGYPNSNIDIMYDLNPETGALVEIRHNHSLISPIIEQPSSYIKAPLELPEQLKVQPYKDPFSRPLNSENPWEEYWPKYQKVESKRCKLGVCLSEYAFYQSVFYSDPLIPIKIPVIHLRNCEISKVYCCEACDHSFRERKMLEEHIIGIHFPNLPPHYFLCHTCGKFSRAGRPFKIHLERHCSESKFLCDQCAMSFPSKTQLKSHYLTHADESSDHLSMLVATGHKNAAAAASTIFRCPICSKNFNNRNEMNYHMYTHTGLKPYVCTVCSKSYIKKVKLLEHIKSHTGEKPFKCYSCLQAFPHRKLLQEHVATVHGNQNYKCKQCDKTYSFEPHLVRHMKVHSGHNPYTCHICDKDFYRKEKLQRHLFVHDSNTLYKCEVCHKGYSTREVLEKHICVREKGCENIVFKCPLCPRKFTFKKNLELHIAHHQPNEVRNDRKKVPKQYYCNLCPKAFVHLKKLNRHLLFHQKYPNLEGGIPIIVEEKKFKCHLCPKTFIKNFYLKKHLENHYKYATSTRRPKNAAAFVNNLNKQQQMRGILQTLASGGLQQANRDSQMFGYNGSATHLNILHGSSSTFHHSKYNNTNNFNSGTVLSLNNNIVSHPSNSNNFHDTNNLFNTNDLLMVPLNEFNKPILNWNSLFNNSSFNSNNSGSPSDLNSKHTSFNSPSDLTPIHGSLSNGLDAQLFLNNNHHIIFNPQHNGLMDYHVGTGNVLSTVDANAFLNDIPTCSNNFTTLNFSGMDAADISSLKTNALPSSHLVDKTSKLTAKEDNSTSYKDSKNQEGSALEPLVMTTQENIVDNEILDADDSPPSCHQPSQHTNEKQSSINTPVNNTSFHESNILNSLDQNSMYTLMRIQEDGSLAAASGSTLEDNQTLFKVFEQLQQHDQGSDTTPSLIIIQTDN